MAIHEADALRRMLSIALRNTGSEDLQCMKRMRCVVAVARFVDDYAFRRCRSLCMEVGSGSAPRGKIIRQWDGFHCAPTVRVSDRRVVVLSHLVIRGT